jgi:predicted small secreted protein
MKYLKYLAATAAVAMLVGCGTVGGAISGAGKDLSRAGEWISNQ